MFQCASDRSGQTSLICRRMRISTLFSIWGFQVTTASSRFLSPGSPALNDKNLPVLVYLKDGESRLVLATLCIRLYPSLCQLIRLACTQPNLSNGKLYEVQYDLNEKIVHSSGLDFWPLQRSSTGSTVGPPTALTGYIKLAVGYPLSWPYATSKMSFS